MLKEGNCDDEGWMERLGTVLVDGSSLFDASSAAVGMCSSLVVLLHGGNRDVEGMLDRLGPGLAGGKLAVHGTGDRADR